MKDIFLFLLFPFAIIMIAFFKKRKEIISLYENPQSDNFVGTLENHSNVVNDKQDRMYDSNESYSESSEEAVVKVSPQNNHLAEEGKYAWFRFVFWIIIAVLSYLFRVEIKEKLHDLIVYIGLS